MSSEGEGSRRGRGGTGSGRASSYDVAALAGVSQSAVSRAFRPGSYLSDDLRTRVLAAAEQLGFRPNAMARGLATSRSGIVAVAIGTIANPMYPPVLDALSRRLTANGLQLLLLSELEAPEGIAQRALQYQADAVLVTASLDLEPSRIITSRCESAGVPVVLYNRVLAGCGAPAVTCANRESGRLVADLLLRAGHRRLAVIAGNEETTANADRRDGFVDRVREVGGYEPRVETTDYTYASGRAALLRLLAGPDRPDGLFCCNDVMAIGAMDAARNALRLRVPEDLSIVGFDDVPVASWEAYDLTTVRQRVDRMAEVAVDLVCRRVRGEACPAHTVIPADLVVRSSARFPSGDGDRGET